MLQKKRDGKFKVHNCPNAETPRQWARRKIFIGLWGRSNNK